MSEKTLGQIAYEEWAEIVHPAGTIPWDRVGMQVGWENIAQAVVQEEARRFEELVLNPPPLKPADKAVLDEIGPTPFRDLRNLRKEQRQQHAEIERLREEVSRLMCERTNLLIELNNEKRLRYTYQQTVATAATHIADLEARTPVVNIGDIQMKIADAAPQKGGL